MARLVLLRHAKAASAAVNDLERPLTSGGLEQCRLVAGKLRNWLPAGFQVMISPSRRTRETWSTIAELLEDPPAATVDPAVYEATPETLLELVQSASADDLVLVGHSPGIPRLAHLLCADPSERFAALIRTYPTSGCVVLEAPEPLSLWQPGCAEVLAAFSGELPLNG